MPDARRGKRLVRRFGDERAVAYQHTVGNAADLLAHKPDEAVANVQPRAFERAGIAVLGEEHVLFARVGVIADVRARRIGVDFDPAHYLRGYGRGIEGYAVAARQGRQQSEVVGYRDAHTPVRRLAVGGEVVESGGQFAAVVDAVLREPARDRIIRVFAQHGSARRQYREKYDDAYRGDGSRRGERQRADALSS